MAGIVRWTPARRAALRRLIDIERQTYAQAAAALQARYRGEPPYSERGCREIGQAMRLAARTGRPPRDEGKKFPK